MKIKGSRSDPEEPVAEADYFQNHNSTFDNIMIGIFVDGSFDAKTGAGAYSVVFRNFSPGSEDDGKVIKMGWPMDAACDNNLSEIAAVVRSRTSIFHHSAPANT